MDEGNFVHVFLGIGAGLVLFGIPIIVVIAGILKRKHCSSCKDNAACERRERKRLQEHDHMEDENW